RRLHVLLLDSTAFHGGQERDRAMAERLHAARTTAPHDLFVVLTGNIHNRVRPGTPWDRAYEPMGYLFTRLEPKLAATSLDVAFAGGSAWTCTSAETASCQTRTLKGRP